MQVLGCCPRSQEGMLGVGVPAWLTAPVPPMQSPSLRLGLAELLTESQHGRGWKGPLWVTQSKPLPKQGHPQQAVEELVQEGLEYLQRRRLPEPWAGEGLCLLLFLPSEQDLSPLPARHLPARSREGAGRVPAHTSIAQTRPRVSLSHPEGR